ncbi:MULTISPECIES: alpha-hydroxy acid oxidase [Asaia]|uniref:L-lactate dehydrogenase n=1 Tax=Asaia bogorensis TaxID=91915 RepID=A0A060QM98_9PROT|nr:MULTISPECIES: alpha-hydroxy acid oxidase [Asaia]ETC97622.1 FMN-dependent family dehydrogenase [Asaia sp. SF2.1]MDL2170424.1 alpha-hydroxy acid oxidase [Asaia sp. HumB]CDG41152.1 L-lactate dehydrogenase [Asaia bogorensis]
MSITAKRRLKDIYQLTDFEKAVKRYLPKAVYEYVRNGAGSEITLRRNRAVFQRYLWRPYRLRDVSSLNTKITLLGETYDQPFGFAPTGGAAMTRYDADRIEASTARRHNLFYALSANSLTPLEEIIRINPRAWFAAYLPSDMGIIDGMIDRVQEAGYPVLLITCDVPVPAQRIAETRAGYSMPIRPNLRATLGGMAHPGWTFGTLGRTILRDRNPKIVNIRPQGGPGLFSNEIAAVGGSPHFTWDHIRHIRSRWKGKLVLKGLLRPEDIAEAARIGADAVGISDHGARLLDSTIAPLEALGDIRQAAGDMAVIVDSGFRCGGDVLKALTLGADAVMLGRPFLQACALAGSAGLDKAISILSTEISRDLALLGVTGLESLKEDLLKDLGDVRFAEQATEKT